MSSKTEQAERADYEVGYGKPPRAHQFKKGMSGNPGGRGKKLMALVNSKFATVDPKDPAGRTFGERYVDKLFELALDDGNVQALKEIGDRIAGRPRQTMDLTVDRRQRFERAIESMIEEAQVSGEEISHAEAAAALVALRPDYADLVDDLSDELPPA
jgi:Family of unknown function (DUF5681)